MFKKGKPKKLKKGAPLVSLHDLMVVKLCEVYDVEVLITKTLPKMMKKIESEQLQSLVKEHLSETEDQIKRLKQIFEMVGEPAKIKKSYAMRGIVDDVNSLLKLKGEPTVMDAGIIAALQAVEHHEIAAYGTLAAWSDLMAHDEVTDLLQKTLDEEKMADEKLSALAEIVINVEADMNDDTEEGEEETVL